MSKKVPQDEVSERLAPFGVTVLSEYVGRTVPIDIRCNTCGFEDARLIDSMTAGGSACRACRFKAGDPVKGVIAGLNDLATLFPEVAAEADGWDPTTVVSRAHTKMPWVCAKGHRWVAALNNRTRASGGGCPVCGNKVFIPGQNDLATLRPDLAAEADGWDPATVVAGTAAMKSWKCSLGHTWNATINHRVSAGKGCPYCAGQKVWVGFNDFASQNPELLSQVHGWDPTTVTANSGRNFEWICTLGHVWKATPDRRSNGSGCPYCLSQAVWPGFNDFATHSPHLLGWVDGWDPTTVTNKSGTKRKWRCPEGHPFQMVVSHMANGSGCPVCLNDQIIVGINDLATTHPELAAQAQGWDPTTVVYGSAKAREWICSLGHVWKTSAASRSYMKTGCPTCSGRITLAGFNDLATIRPDIAAQAHEWDPSTVTISAGVSRKWICAEGHVWRSIVAGRTQGRGCPTCAIGGFDPNARGYLYFLEHDGLDMFQIGITNKPDDRLAIHKRGGWDVLEVRGPMDGQLAADLETDMLRVAKRRGAVFANKAGVKRFDGWSEAWTKASFSVSSIRELIELVYEDDSINEPKRRKPRQGGDSAARYLSRDT